MVLEKKLFKLLLPSLALLAMPFLAMGSGSDIGSADIKVLEGLYPGKAYSPYAKRSFPNKVLWGETHHY